MQVLNTLFSNSHPLFFCVTLIFYSLIVSLIIYNLLNKWLTLSLILIFLGGIIVVFIYITTLAHNEKLKLEKSITYFLILFRLIVLIPPLVKPKFINILSLYTSHFSPLLIFLTLYLLICLFSVVKLCQSFKGAIRKFSLS